MILGDHFVRVLASERCHSPFEHAKKVFDGSSERAVRRQIDYINPQEEALEVKGVMDNAIVENKHRFAQIEPDLVNLNIFLTSSNL